MRFISQRSLYQLHRWLGLHLGLLLFVICFSGTFAVLSNEVDWLANEALRLPGSSTEATQWQAMKDSLDRRFPEATQLGLYKETYTGNGAHFATSAYVRVPNGQTLKVYLNPHTGAIQGYTSFFNAQRFFRSFHRRFFDGGRGIVIVTLCSLPFLLSILSGFLFYKKWLQTIFQLRWRGSIRMRWADLHRLAGFWSLLFALLVALSSIFYLSELILQQTGQRAALQEPAPAKIPAERLGQYPETLKFKPLSTYVDSAQAACSDLEVKTIRLPQKPGDFVYLDGQGGNPLTRNRANYVLLDPLDASVVHVQQSEDLGLLPLISELVDPLHFGYFGGLISKGVWFLFGLVVSLSVLSGTYLWVLKTLGQKTRKRKARAISRGLGVAIALTIAYLGWTAWATVQGIQSYAAGPVPSTRVVAQHPSLPLHFVLSHQSTSGKLAKEYHIREQRGAGMVNLQSVVLESPRRKDTFQRAGRDWRLPIDDPMQNQEAEGQYLLLTRYDGARKIWRIPLGAIREAHAALSGSPERIAQDPNWPQMAPGIWWYIGLFILATVAIILLWGRWVLRALRK